MDKLRQRYLRLVTSMLKENVRETSDLLLDDLSFIHFGMEIEEGIYDKNRDLASYSKAITRSRLSIERHTRNKKLFPLIATAMQSTESQVNSAHNNSMYNRKTVNDSPLTLDFILVR